MKNKILDVFSVIYKRRQKIGFALENLDKELFLAPSNIKQDTGIDIFEVELLIGSLLLPVFYKKGEIMFNKGICTSENTILKNFRFDLQAPLNELKIINCDKLLKFKKIKKVFTFLQEDKNIVGLEIEDEKPIYISTLRLNMYTQIDPANFEILTGSYIYPVYYKEGEQLESGVSVKKSDIILKNLNLRFTDTVENMINKFPSAKSIPPGFHNWDSITIDLV